MASAAPAARVAPYDLVNPLFSDHAIKDRFLFVPAGEVSVMPQPPRMSCPVAAFSLRAVSTGSGAPPEAQ